MRNKILLLLVILPTILSAQKNNFELGFSIGNNGQLDKILNDFYWLGHESAFLDDSQDDKTSNIKYTASARYFFSENISARLKFGKAIRKDFYIKSPPVTYIEYKMSQSEINISPSICFSRSFDKFEIMTGFEVPLIFVDDFNYDTYSKSFPDGVTVIGEGYVNISMDGGFIWGLNNFIGVKYYFKNWLAAGTEINYGLLFADLGGKVTHYSEPIIPASAPSSTEYEKKYKKTFFSAPEVSFGIFIRFGKAKSNCPA